jgi:20S proteasome subunit alpha 1
VSAERKHFFGKKKVLGEDFKATDIEVGLVSKRDRRFRKLATDEIKGHLNEIQEID